MNKKKKPVNISINADVLAEFDRIINLNGFNRSWILQECMKAYSELYERCQRAGVKRLPTLEFKGCENENCAGVSPQLKNGDSIAKVRILVPSRSKLKR